MRADAIQKEFYSNPILDRTMMLTLEQALQNHAEQMKSITETAIKNNNKGHFDFWCDLATRIAIDEIPMGIDLVDFKTRIALINEKYKEQTKFFV